MDAGAVARARADSDQGRAAHRRDRGVPRALCAGDDVPDAPPRGHEDVLVLEGSYVDSSGAVYNSGDVHTLEGGTEHSFTIAPDEPCVAAAVHHGIRFSSLGLRLLAEAFWRLRRGRNRRHRGENRRSRAVALGAVVRWPAHEGVRAVEARSRAGCRAVRLRWRSGELTAARCPGTCGHATPRSTACTHGRTE